MKINRYEFKCVKCGIDYAEQRTDAEPQYFNTCSCGGKFKAGKTILIEEIIDEAITE